MRPFAVPKVQTARSCRVGKEPGGSTLNAATRQLHGLSIEPRIAQRALGN